MGGRSCCIVEVRTIAVGDELARPPGEAEVVLRCSGIHGGEGDPGGGPGRCVGGHCCRAAVREHRRWEWAGKVDVDDDGVGGGPRLDLDSS